MAILWLGLSLAVWGIPPHRLSLEQVLRQPHRVARVKVLDRQSESANHGHRWRFRLQILSWETPSGTAVGEVEATYFEGLMER